MSKMPRLVCPIFLVILLLPSCSFFKKKPIALGNNSNIRLSGRVQSVNESARFVLIRRYGPWRVAEGQIVESRGDGRSASLMPTGEKLGEHVAADIRGGSVEVGDGVYIRTIIKGASKTPFVDEEINAALKAPQATVPEPVVEESLPAPVFPVTSPTTLIAPPKVRASEL